MDDGYTEWDLVLEKREMYMMSKLEEQKREAIQAISSILSRDMAESFAKILSSAWEFNCPEAEKIANLLGFNQMDFMAIDENLEGYGIYMKQQWDDELVESQIDYAI